jgi:hypothetical protein
MAGQNHIAMEYKGQDTTTSLQQSKPHPGPLLQYDVPEPNEACGNQDHIPEQEKLDSTGQPKEFPFFPVGGILLMNEQQH